MLDRAYWTLTVAAVLQDKYDDRIYFADPDKLDAITIDVSNKRTGSPAYIREFNAITIIPRSIAYHFAKTIARVKLRPSELYSHPFGKTDTPNRIANPTAERERLQRGKLH
jgi:hypothetical protein